MRMERLTLKAQEALRGAQESATGRHHADIQPLHLLHTLVTQEGGMQPEKANNSTEAVVLVTDLGNNNAAMFSSHKKNGRRCCPKRSKTIPDSVAINALVG